MEITVYSWVPTQWSVSYKEKQVLFFGNILHAKYSSEPHSVVWSSRRGSSGGLDIIKFDFSWNLKVVSRSSERWSWDCYSLRFICFREDSGTQISQRGKRVNDNLNVLRSLIFLWHSENVLHLATNKTQAVITCVCMCVCVCVFYLRFCFIPCWVDTIIEHL